MTVHPKAPGHGAWAADFGDVRRPSFAAAGTGDMLILIGVLTIACGLGGLGDDSGDVAWLALCGTIMVGTGLQTRRRYVRPRRTTPGRILRGLGLIWCAACLLGAAIYLLTGTVGRIDDALLESTAGFTTTNLTTLDPTQLSRSIVLWRSGTQWVGGYLAIVLSVVAIPEALKGTALLASRGDPASHDLVSNAIRGRQRIMMLYAGFTVVVVVGYLATGLGAVDAITHGLSTTSTGGFSTRADSFAGFGTGPRTVATAAMLVAGSSIFILWWIARGRLKPIWQSTELRVYLIIVSLATALLIIDVDGISVGDALFTATSISSTTGFAIGDWTSWSDDAAGMLLVVVAIGSMLGSAGGGFRVMRAQLMFMYATRELRHELDPRAVLIVKHRGRALDERTMNRLAGFQISYLAVCGAAALFMAALGTSVIGSVWGATSAVSNFGPAIGEIGSFGSADALAAPARAVLIPAMLAGRLSIMPALVILVWGLRSRKLVTLRARRLLTTAARSFGRGASGG